MRYGLYWANDRFQGYGIPAYCDHKGCKETIDRGLGYLHCEDIGTLPVVFCCPEHQSIRLEDFPIEWNKEHPDWLNWIISDNSWKTWREENPDIIDKYKELLKKEN